MPWIWVNTWGCLCCAAPLRGEGPQVLLDRVGHILRGDCREFLYAMNISKGEHIEGYFVEIRKRSALLLEQAHLLALRYEDAGEGGASAHNAPQWSYEMAADARWEEMRLEGSWQHGHGQEPPEGSAQESGRLRSRLPLHAQPATGSQISRARILRCPPKGSAADALRMLRRGRPAGRPHRRGAAPARLPPGVPRSRPHGARFPALYAFSVLGVPAVTCKECTLHTARRRQPRGCARARSG
eukprot:gene16929-biopygen3343